MEYPLKEVDFAKYCRTCQYWEREDIDDPCNLCLEEPANEYSHKPIEYVEDPKKVKILEKEQKIRG